MQALSDEQRMEALEKKIDSGFAEMRAEFKAVRSEMRMEFRAVRSEIRTEIADVRGEARSDYRLLLGILLTMYMTIILGFAGLFLQHV